MTKRKLRHGQQIITYRWTIYDQYKWGENYLHPEIIVQPATVRDPLAEYAKYPDDHYLERAKRIRACTSDTLYIDTSYGLSESFSVRFQTNRESGGDRGYHYPPCYGAKITDCGFDARTIAIAAKLAKQCNANWSIGVLDVVAALKEMKAQAVIWSKDADCLILCDHLEDSMFGLPADLRQPTEVVAA